MALLQVDASAADGSEAEHVVAHLDEVGLGAPRQGLDKLDTGAVALRPSDGERGGGLVVEEQRPVAAGCSPCVLSGLLGFVADRHAGRGEAGRDNHESSAFYV